MTPRLITLLVCFLLVGAATSQAEDTDLVLAKLNQAKAAYETAREQYRDGVGKYLDKREDAARAKGDKKLVDQIKAEREAFMQKGELPPMAPLELKRKLTAARTAMEQAYAAAVRDYTKTKKDAEATAVEKELEEFKRGDVASWTPLFNGKDIKGWRESDNNKTTWRVENGSLIGTGEFGYLVTERTDYDNFRLRVEVMIAPGGDSGVCFRVQDRQVRLCYEAQVGQRNTGALVLFNGSESRLLVETSQPSKAGVWYELEIVAQDNQLTYFVDGKQTAQYQDTKKSYTRGAIALQQIGAKGAIHFRKVEIKELPSK